MQPNPLTTLSLRISPRLPLSAHFFPIYNVPLAEFGKPGLRIIFLGYVANE